MPPPIATREQWRAVQDTAVALDSLEAAARQHAINPATVRQRAKRESWPVATRLAPAIAAAQAAQIKHLADRRSRERPDLPPAMSHPVTVTSAVTQDQADTGARTKAVIARKLLSSVTAFADKLPPDQMQSLKAAAQAGAVLHGWGDQAKAGRTLNIISDKTIFMGEW